MAERSSVKGSPCGCIAAPDRLTRTAISGDYSSWEATSRDRSSKSGNRTGHFTDIYTKSPPSLEGVSMIVSAERPASTPASPQTERNPITPFSNLLTGNGQGDGWHWKPNPESMASWRSEA